MTMQRRHFVRMLSAGALIACPICRSAIAAEEKKHWSYQGETGPDAWGGLSPENQACGAGNQQSPIDLSSHVPSVLYDLEVHWRPAEFQVVNNGHTIQANGGAGSHVMLGGLRYELLQFHFHAPSEHTVDGRPYAMECHFVHKTENGGLTVLGVFMTPGAEHAELVKVWSAMPTEHGGKTLSDGPVNHRRLLPASAAVYRYAGSLTTPPCSEVVNWVVYRDPIEVSREQIQQFTKLYPANARPVQALNRRFVLGNF